MHEKITDWAYICQLPTGARNGNEQWSVKYIHWWTDWTDPGPLLDFFGCWFTFPYCHRTTASVLEIDDGRDQPGCLQIQSSQWWSITHFKRPWIVAVNFPNISMMKVVTRQEAKRQENGGVSQLKVYKQTKVERMRKIMDFIEAVRFESAW